MIVDSLSIPGGIAELIHNVRAVNDGKTALAAAQAISTAITVGFRDADDALADAEEAEHRDDDDERRSSAEKHFYTLLWKRQSQWKVHSNPQHILVTYRTYYTRT